MYFIKENGTKVVFDKNKIKRAISAAMRDGGVYLPDIARLVANDAEKYFIKNNVDTVTREQVDKYLFDRLVHYGQPLTAKSYEDFKVLRKYQKQTTDTDESIIGLVTSTNKDVMEENSNKDARITSTVRDLIAGEVSKSISRRKILPAHLIHAHDEGLIHIHDMDYLLQPTHNCCLINLKDMLNNGTVVNGVLIERPHSIQVAANVATQIVACVASAQYGGQTISTAHLAPFVRESYNYYYFEALQEFEEVISNKNKRQEVAKKIADKRTKKAVRDAVQTLQYQINTLCTSNGQTPFVSIFMRIDEEPEYEKENAMLIEEIIKQRYEGLKDREGHYVTAAFPKLLYLLDENNTYEGSEYFYLTELAAKCTAKRLVPDYISAKIMRENKNGDVYPCMGCRSFLSPDIVGFGENGEHKYYGRWNGGVVTVNLVDAALSAEGDIEKFWEILRERCELCKEALLIRIKRVEEANPDIAPILWRDGALARLKEGETIASMTKNGYSTLSLGYIGCAEACYALIGESNTSEKGEKLALQIMQFLHDICDEWKADTGYGFSLYGTPAEATTYTLAKTTKNRFGEIPHVTDKLYLTNSYHVKVDEPIDAFSKLKFEAQFQQLSSGGAISYVEVPNMQDNIPAVIQLIQYIYETIQYAEINCKSDLCENCGFDGEIIVNDNLEWICPQCGCKDHNKLHVARRTCGYIGSNFWNKGRTQEIAERVLHLE
jgi:ribonucleoside-triphosphate reductase